MCHRKVCLCSCVGIVYVPSSTRVWIVNKKDQNFYASAWSVHPSISESISYSLWMIRNDISWETWISENFVATLSRQIQIFAFRFIGKAFRIFPTMTLGRNDSAPILTSLSNHRKGQKWTMNGRWRDSVGSRRTPNPGPGSYSGVAPSSYKYASSAAFGFGSGSRAVFTKDGNPGMSRNHFYQNLFRTVRKLYPKHVPKTNKITLINECFFKVETNRKSFKVRISMTRVRWDLLMCPSASVRQAARLLVQFFYNLQKRKFRFAFNYGSILNFQWFLVSNSCPLEYARTRNIQTEKSCW